MRDFQEFCLQSELSDLAYVGPKFTWWNHQDENPTGKKLDRALVNQEWRSSFIDSYAKFETNGISDHSRCLVHTTNVQPLKRRYHFQFFNFLCDHPKFLDVVASCWQGMDPLFHSCSALYRFNKKLKLLKPHMRELNRGTYGDISSQTKQAFDLLCEKQNSALLNPSLESFAEESRAAEIWEHLASVEEQFFRQKSRIRWLKNGDKNTKYFHRMVQARTSKNCIRRLIKVDGTEITGIDELQVEAINHFQNFLKGDDENQEDIDHNLLHNLINFWCTQSMADDLTSPVTGEEIRRVLEAMPSSKAPGPDGYTAEFYRKAWPVIGKDLIVAVQSFFDNGFMPHGVNSTILTLVPKTDDAKRIKDYRPIACCNMLYKIISKIIANRLKQTLPESMVPNQSAFIEGRLLLENVLLATELVKDYHKQTISSRCALKLDISKAFDTVRWDFIIAVLQTMGFPMIFVHWIRSCISTAAFSVSVNGNLGGFFTSKRGLRQGCSLSPYLFVIVMNVLSLLLNKKAVEGRIGYHPQCKELNITHLSFADDMLVFMNGSHVSLSQTMRVLNVFGSMSGLRINASKSSIFPGGRTNEQLGEAAAGFGIQVAALPIRYLGVPLTTKSLTRTDYEPLVDKIRSKMVAWSTKTLSFAGRLQLIKSVITSITNFWCSIFRLPQKCYDTIESMCAAFLWSGSPFITTKAKVRWSDICYPKAEGGLGIRRLQDTGRVFSLSLIWKLFQDTTSLWASWTKYHLIRQASFWDIADGSRGSWIWRKLLKLRVVAKDFVKADLQNGRKIMFWFDNWLSIGCLHDIAGNTGQRIMGIPKTARVADVCHQGEWRIRDRRSVNLQGIIDHIRLLQPPHDLNGPDQYFWKHGPDSYKPQFSASRMWEQLRPRRDTVPWHSLVWFSLASPSRAFLTWLALLDKLSTGTRMAMWGFHQPCVLCGEQTESRDHLFFACPYSYTVWTTIIGNLLGPRANPDWSITLREILRSRRSSTDFILLRICLQAAIYGIWRERNNRRHHRPWTSYYGISHLLIKEITIHITSMAKSGTEDTGRLLARWIAART